MLSEHLAEEVEATLPPTLHSLPGQENLTVPSLIPSSTIPNPPALTKNSSR